MMGRVGLRIESSFDIEVVIRVYRREINVMAKDYVRQVNVSAIRDGMKKIVNAELD